MRRSNGFKSLKNQNVRKSADTPLCRGPCASSQEKNARRQRQNRLNLHRCRPQNGMRISPICKARSARAEPCGPPTEKERKRERERKKNRQLACKPGSVWPRHPKATERGSHSSGTTFARSLLQPTRMTGPETGWALARPRHPYSVLLPVGFAVPSMSPCPRWALTPPFHPYSASGAVCFLWHFP